MPKQNPSAETPESLQKNYKHQYVGENKNINSTHHVHTGV